MLRMRPAGSPADSLRTSGLLPTPVSYPESPIASSGNTTTAAAVSLEKGSPWFARRAFC